MGLEGSDVTDQMQGLREDVAFMRALAEEGRNAPPIGGSMMAAAGLVWGAASLIFYAELQGIIDPPGQGLVWLAAMVLFAVVGITIVLRIRRTPGYTAARNQATGAAWSSVGYAIFAIWAAFAVAAYRTGDDLIFYMFAPIIIALYGLAWSVVATLSGKLWQKAVAGLAFVFAVAMAWFTGEPEQFMIYAAALVLTALLPGLYLMQQARAARA